RAVMTIAFVPFEAPDTAAFLALGCSEIVMGQDGKFGSFNALVNPQAALPQARPGRRPPPPPAAPPVSSDAVRDSLRQLAQEQGYSPVLIQGLFDTNLEIYRVRSKKGTIERRFVTKEDLDLDQQGERRWENEGQIKAAGQLLDLTSAKAKDYGIARYVVDIPREPRELYVLYGIDPSRVRQAAPDWLGGADWGRAPTDDPGLGQLRRHSHLVRVRSGRRRRNGLHGRPLPAEDSVRNPAGTVPAGRDGRRRCRGGPERQRQRRDGGPSRR